MRCSLKQSSGAFLKRNQGVVYLGHITTTLRVLEAKLDTATSGRGRRQPNELWHPAYRLGEGSRPRGMALRRGPSNAPAGVGYKKTENYNSELTGIVSFLDKGPAYCGPQW